MPQLIGFISEETLGHLLRAGREVEIKSEATQTAFIPLLADIQSKLIIQNAYVWSLPITEENVELRARELLCDLANRLRFFPNVDLLKSGLFCAALASLLMEIPNILNVEGADRFMRVLTETDPQYDTQAPELDDRDQAMQELADQAQDLDMGYSTAAQATDTIWDGPDAPDFSISGPSERTR